MLLMATANGTDNTSLNTLHNYRSDIIIQMWFQLYDISFMPRRLGRTMTWYKDILSLIFNTNMLSNGFEI